MEYPIDRPGIDPIIRLVGRHPVQPKREICTSLARLGFNVAPMFDTLDDALDSGEAIMGRSEAPFELYTSGVTTTLTADNPDKASVIRDVSAALTDPDRTLASIMRLANRKVVAGFGQAELWRRYMNPHSLHEADSFAREHSLSYWSRVPGDIWYIQADDAVTKRYVMARAGPERQFVTVDQGKTTVYGDPWRKGSVAVKAPSYDKFVETYETIRATYDRGNACTVEFVDTTEEAPITITQLTPGRIQLEEPVLETEQEPEHIVFVRGATPKEGVEFILYKPYEKINAAGIAKTPHFSCSLSGEMVGYDEFVLPQMTVMFLNARHELPQGYLQRQGISTVDHSSRSVVHKPQVTIALRGKAFEDIHEAAGYAFEGLRCKIYADGRRAVVKYVTSKNTVETIR